MLKRLAILTIIILLFIETLCLVKFLITQYNKEQNIIGNCINRPLCIHTVRHTQPDVILCIQNKKCYQYLKENLK